MPARCGGSGCVHRHWPHEPSDRTLTAVPLYHKNAMAGAVKTVLHAGATTVILPNFEPRRFLETLAGYRITHSGGVPAVFTLLLQHKDLLASLDFSALKGLKIGSAPTARELQEAVEAAFGVPVGESYGLTEGGPVMIGTPLDGRPVPKGSCGVVWPEGEVKLIGTDGKESESYGELWVRNPGVTPGYHNLPAVNRQRLVDGWLRTGDLFHRDADGFFFFKGRTDDMFNCGGENIYPLEVEGLLLTHPDVADVSVVPVAHAIKGEVPVAMVVRRKGAAARRAGGARFRAQERSGLCPSAARLLRRRPAAQRRRQDRPAGGRDHGPRAARRHRSRPGGKTMSALDLDHIGIAVRDLDAASAAVPPAGLQAHRARLSHAAAGDAGRAAAARRHRQSLRHAGARLSRADRHLRSRLWRPAEGRHRALPGRPHRRLRHRRRRRDQPRAARPRPRDRRIRGRWSARSRSPTGPSWPASRSSTSPATSFPRAISSPSAI